MKKYHFFWQFILLTGFSLTSPIALSADEVKVGVMLPATGTYARLGSNIQKGFKLYVEEQGGKLAGRDIKFVNVDSEGNPSKAVDNVNKLIKQHDVDVLVGSVHSGVAMAMAKAAKSSGKLMIVPNAGANQVTGPFCGVNIYRTSFSSWQTGYAAGEAMGAKGFKKVVTITWKYGAGQQMVEGFKEAFEKSGGEVIEEMWVPFPKVEWQAQLTQIAALKPDGVFTFFAGGGAVKFVKDYAAAGLKENFPLYGTGFLTDGTLQGQGEAAEGVMTALHYADDMDVEKDRAFRKAYAKAYNGESPDVYAVQGYDAAQLLDIGLTGANGDPKNVEAFSKAVRSATIDSPRGPFKLSKAHNPIQDFYLREVKGGKNIVVGIAAKALEDPAKGCKLK